VGLVPAGDDYTSETVKKYVDGTGTMSLSITKVDGNTGEFAGVFTAIQPSDTDMGTKQALDVKITGEVYGRLEQV
jgi:photosystem II oxygen-evolving enhancer protein 1